VFGDIFLKGVSMESHLCCACLGSLIFVVHDFMCVILLVFVGVGALIQQHNSPPYLFVASLNSR
jgi:hypothetical protein